MGDEHDVGDDPRADFTKIPGAHTRLIAARRPALFPLAAGELMIDVVKAPRVAARTPAVATRGRHPRPMTLAPAPVAPRECTPQLPRLYRRGHPFRPLQVDAYSAASCPGVLLGAGSPTVCPPNQRSPVRFSFSPSLPASPNRRLQRAQSGNISRRHEPSTAWASWDIVQAKSRAVLRTPRASRTASRLISHTSPLNSDICPYNVMEGSA